MSAPLGQSPSMTVGPFFHFGMISGGENVLVRPGARGLRMEFSGHVIDGDGAIVPDALVEIWQADADGIHQHPSDPRSAQADPHFFGFGRSDTTHAGQTFRFETIKPGRVPGPDGILQAPHFNLRIFSRGLLTHLQTRVYFADEPDANGTDIVLNRVPLARRATLLTTRSNEPSSIPVYRLDLVLQGKNETVFFEP
jgi:protocatechuate 3,4-dioxygenase alpha subunit